MKNTISILLPDGEVDSQLTTLAQRLPSLRGRRIGFVTNAGWRSFPIACDELAKVFTSEYGVRETETIDPGPQHLPERRRIELEGLSRRVDAVVSGLGY